MNATQLARAVWESQGLQSTVSYLSVRLASSELPIEPISPEHKQVNWFHLLRCASVFLEADDTQLNDAGLTIAHSALILSESRKICSLSATLLTKFASNPSVDLARRRNLIQENLLETLPLPLALDVYSRQVEATINIGRASEFVGNQFQNSLWNALSQADWVSASAPTSAGKSFLLKKWIEHTIKTRSATITFFIVPTRALISQVESDLRELLKDQHPQVSITSLPLAFQTDSNHNIFVYTQERFHLYLTSHSAHEAADLIIIDEAQQIGSDQRGILLQQVLELAAVRFASAKVLFASPSTSNPQRLLSFAPKGKKTSVISDSRPTVNQNLIWLEQTGRLSTTWNVSLMVNGERAPMGHLTLQNRPAISQKLPFLAFALGNSTGANVVYVNRASDAEKVSEILCQFIKNEIDDPELEALSELCEKAVHSQFMLRRFVRKGVAFHYGNIPQLIRSETERLFSAGKIQYLVCTSTLVEGVNLSCRNIFMRNPKRGVRTLMSTEDFWNLAGRAGRWGKEFQGNVFCIDPLSPGEWIEGRAPSVKRPNEINVASERLAADFTSFLDYVRGMSEVRGSKARFYDYLLSYLVFKLHQFGRLADAIGNLSTAQVAELQQTIDHEISNLRVPIDIVLRNPGINPQKLSMLYDYFAAKPDAELSNLIPVDPLSGSREDEGDEPARDSTVQNFIEIFSRITKYLGANLGNGPSAYGNARLVVDWMRGYPLNRIIDGQLRYWRRRDLKKHTATVIRETMERVEKVARFEAPKYLQAYLDVLRIALQSRGRKDLLSEDRSFWLFLEFGVSKRTQLSLMSLGLSRSSAIALSTYIVDDQLSEELCLDWLEKNPWREFGLPKLVELEVHTVTLRHNRNRRETDS